MDTPGESASSWLIRLDTMGLRSGGHLVASGCPPCWSICQPAQGPTWSHGDEGLLYIPPMPERTPRSLPDHHPERKMYKLSTAPGRINTEEE